MHQLAHVAQQKARPICQGTADEERGKIFAMVNILLAILLGAVVATDSEALLMSSTENHCDAVDEVPSTFEPSGLAYTAETDELFAVDDNGYVAKYNGDGAFQYQFDTGLKDLEAITFAENDYTKLYLGHEYPSVIHELQISTQALTGRSWSLTDFPGNGDHALEGLTWVPNSMNSSSGLFYAGNQFNGLVYVYDADLSSTSTNNNATLVASLNLNWTTSQEDCSGLNYDRATGYVQAISDKNEEMIIFEPVDKSSLKEGILDAEVKIVTRSSVPAKDQVRSFCEMLCHNGIVCSRVPLSCGKIVVSFKLC